MGDDPMHTHCLALILVTFESQRVIQVFVHPIPQNYCTAHQTVMFLSAPFKFSVI